VDRQLRSIGRRRRWTCGAWHRSLCLLIEVGERWRRLRANSPLLGNQAPDQSSSGKPGRRRRSWNRHVVVLVASGAVAVSVWCGRAVMHRLSAVWYTQVFCIFTQRDDIIIYLPTQYCQHTKHCDYLSSTGSHVVVGDGVVSRVILQLADIGWGQVSLSPKAKTKDLDQTLV